jgi:hypothetical protein
MFAEAARQSDTSFHLGDETGSPTDFFAPAVDQGRMHPSFQTLAESEAYSPALGLMRELMHHFDDRDGNFVEQFQSVGFDARAWELYLYALFVELGYKLVPGPAAPDFHCRGLGGEFFVEATTVNPSADVPSIDESNEGAYFDHYAPLKFGSALFSKLKKRYWDLPHVGNMPLLFAVQDFHAPYAMTWSSTALVEYLYGIRQVARADEHGRQTVVAQAISEFRWGDKPPIPAGFFSQPDSEHVSAVLANPSGTLVKFNRMGFLAGFGRRDVRMIRTGLCYRGEPFPEQFVAAVEGAGYSETWVEGLSVYHNPAALSPVPPEAFPGAAHHILRDGRVETLMPPWFPVGSTTAILVTTDEQRSDGAK